MKSILVHFEAAKAQVGDVNIILDHLMYYENVMCEFYLKNAIWLSICLQL
jgi:hypothetical protein